MKLNAPTNFVWMLAVLLGLLGFLGVLFDVPIVSQYKFWLMFLGWLLLILATLLRKM